jgi:hypothetical protein
LQRECKREREEFEQDQEKRASALFLFQPEGDGFLQAFDSPTGHSGNPREIFSFGSLFGMRYI